MLVALLLLSVATAPARSDDPLEEAERAFSAGDFVTAYRMAGKAAKTDPDNARAHYLAGASGLQLKRQDVAIGEYEAERHLEKALALDPEMAGGAHYLLGNSALERARILAKKGKDRKAGQEFRLASEHFEAELEIAPEEIGALGGLAVALAGIPEPDRSVTAHEAWIDAAPGLPIPYLSLVRALIAAGRLDEAIDQLQRMPTDIPESAFATTFRLALDLYRLDDPAVASSILLTLADRASGEGSPHALRSLGHAVNGWTGPAADELLLFLESDPPADAIEFVAGSYLAMNPMIGPRYFHQRDLHPRPTPEGLRLPERLPDFYVQPSYPEAAKNRRKDGWVVLLTVVRPDGSVVVVHAISGQPGFGFEQSATAAVPQWRYRPASLHGNPVSYINPVLVEFGTW